MKILIKCLKQLSGLKNYKIHIERVLLLFVTISCSGVHYICVLNIVHFSRASKKHQFSTKTIKTKMNQKETVTATVTVSLDMVNFLIQSIFRPRFSQCRIGNYKVGEPTCRNCKPYKCNAEMRCKNQCYG